MADGYFILTWRRWINKDEGYGQAKKNVRKALEFDPNLAEAHATLGALFCWDEWEWEKARKQFQIAIELNPNYATAHQYYSELLEILGQTEEALEELNLALAIDPYSKILDGLKSRLYYKMGKWEELLNIWQVLKKNDPYYAGNWVIFYIYLRRGEDTKAIDCLQEILVEDTLTARYSKSVWEIYGKSRIEGVLKWLIDLKQKDIKPSSYVNLAKLNAFLGNKEESLNWLGKAMEARSSSIPIIINDPDFEILYNEPRFQALVDKMGLNAYHRKSTLTISPPK